MKRFVLSLVLGLPSFAAFAGMTVPPNQLPEPGALSLLAVGAVGGLVIWARNRRKK